MVNEPNIGYASKRALEKVKEMAPRNAPMGVPIWHVPLAISKQENVDEPK